MFSVHPERRNTILYPQARHFSPFPHPHSENMAQRQCSGSRKKDNFSRLTPLPVLFAPPCVLGFCFRCSIGAHVCSTSLSSPNQRVSRAVRGKSGRGGTRRWFRRADLSWWVSREKYEKEILRPAHKKTTKKQRTVERVEAALFDAPRKSSCGGIKAINKKKF